MVLKVFKDSSTRYPLLGELCLMMGGMYITEMTPGLPKQWHWLEGLGFKWLCQLSLHVAMLFQVHPTS